MINGVHQYSTESLIKELEKRELSKQDELRLELIELQKEFRAHAREAVEVIGKPD